MGKSSFALTSSNLSCLILLSFTFHIWMIIISLLITPSTASVQDRSLFMRLIHHHSILSPFHNGSSTVSDHGDFAIQSSMARLAHLDAIIDAPIVPYIQAGLDPIVPYIQAGLVPSLKGTVFFVNVSVGEPPITQLLNMDTGSDLLWIQCRPCTKCEKPIKPVYNPGKSSSFSPIACHPRDCLETFHGHCDSDGYCVYSIRYRDETNSSGIIGYEKFTFQMDGKPPSILPNILFGCAKLHTVKLPRSNGVLGLSAGKEDSYYIHNNLILGDGAVLQGSKTSFQVRNGFYCVSLEGITIAETELPINPQEFKFNVLIDSGATLTYLERKVYEPFKAEVQRIIKTSFESVGEPVKFADYPDLLCYKGNWRREVAHFPDVTLHIAEGLEIYMDSESLFLPFGGGNFCLAVYTKSERNVIGILAQQYYNVGFDLEAKKVSFDNIDCEAIGDQSFSSMDPLQTRSISCF